MEKGKKVKLTLHKATETGRMLTGEYINGCEMTVALELIVSALGDEWDKLKITLERKN